MATGLFSGVLPVEGGVTVTTPNKPPTFVAERLARVFGTEEDPVNCSWFFKVGACRNGDNCYKKHNQPSSSETILLSGLYACTPEGIAISNEQPWTDEMYDLAQQHLEQFYEDVFMTLAEYGELEEVVILDNTTRNLIGNVYAKFYHEEDAHKALKGLTGRFYDGRMICAEFTPVADFREARCRAHHEKRCPRPGTCGFMHIKHVPRAIKRRVVRMMYRAHPELLDRTGKPRSREEYLKWRREEEERRYRQAYPQEEEDIDGVPWSPDTEDDIPDDCMDFYEYALRVQRDGVSEDEGVEQEMEEDGLDGKPWSPSGDTQEPAGRRRRRHEDVEMEQDEGLDGRQWSPSGEAQEGVVRRRRRRDRVEQEQDDGLDGNEMSPSGEAQEGARRRRRKRFRDDREEPNEGYRTFREDREERNEGRRTFREEDEPNEGRRTFREHREERNEGRRTFREEEEPNEGRRTFREDREERNEGRRTFREQPNGERRAFREEPNGGQRTFREDPKVLQDDNGHGMPDEEGPRRRRRRHSSQLEDVDTHRVERSRKLHSSGRGDSPSVQEDDI